MGNHRVRSASTGKVGPQHGTDAQFELGVAALLLVVHRGEGVEGAALVEVDEGENGRASAAAPGSGTKPEDRAQELLAPAGSVSVVLAM